MIPTMDTESALEILDGMTEGESFKFKPIGTSILIEMRPTRQLDGSLKHLISNIGDGSVITLFDKTPFPQDKEDVVCPHFVELKWANGCNFDCAWCYLNGTFRFRPCGKNPFMKDVQKVQSHIRQYLESVPIPTLLNSGELSDSLVFEGTKNALTKIIIPLFKEQEKHKLMILTKSSNVGPLLKTESQDHVIVSFSVNANEVSSRWERNAPTISKRLEAAKKLSIAGYTVRLRIDPMVPIQGWKDVYRSLVDDIFASFTPERITLGSLRGLQSTINFSPDKSWVDYLDDRSNWGKKISHGIRKEMYGTIITYLDDNYDYTDIGLCKETIAMWKEFGREYTNIECNCLL